MDLIEDDPPGDDPRGDNAHEYTVAEISGAVKRSIEGGFGHVRVRGEIGRVSRPKSGHVYLDLKDDRAVLASIIWRGSVAKMGDAIEEGMEVVATGRLTTFPGQSRYQMVIEAMRPAGAGALMAQLERRRQALAAEGLFDEGRKRRLPYLPAVIGVVTSPSGAVIRDILHRLRERCPRHVLVWPVAVQGERCAPEVAAAIAGFNAPGPFPRPDLLIVARGGGSVEDLWGFNDEAVVRAAAASRIPLISAVGHETDTTLIDFAADRRAPTPTAAAELAVPVRTELLAHLADRDARLRRAADAAVRLRGQRLGDLARALPRPDALTAGPAQRLDHAASRLPVALRSVTAARRATLERAAGSLRPGMLRRDARRRREAVGDLARAMRRATARLREDEAQRLARAAAALPPALARLLRARRREAEGLGARVAPALPRRRASEARARFDALVLRLAERAAADHERRAGHLAELERLRQTLGYEETLRRGYAVVHGDGAVVTTRAAAEEAQRLEIQFRDGRLKLGGPRRRTKAEPEKAEQGTLF